MPATTTRLALPYPVPNDTVDVPRDVLALATKLDPATAIFAQGLAAARPAASVPGRIYYATDTGTVTYDTGAAWVAVGGPGKEVIPYTLTLPPTPYDGQEIYYLANAVNGVVWHLRYRADLASAYKWEFVGGSANYAQAALGAQITTGSAYVFGPPLADPRQTFPLAGDYRIQATCGVNTTQGVNDFRMAVFVNGGQAQTAYASVIAPSGYNANWHVDGIQPNVGAGQTADLRFACPSSVAVNMAMDRWMHITPIRVG
jgi:hypothetical protein